MLFGYDLDALTAMGVSTTLMGMLQAQTATHMTQNWLMFIICCQPPMQMPQSMDAMQDQREMGSHLRGSRTSRPGRNPIMKLPTYGSKKKRTYYTVYSFGIGDLLFVLMSLALVAFAVIP